MLDKSIPFLNVMMRCDKPVDGPVPRLPEGYSFSSYREGDDEGWARMETDNLDFDTYEEALAWFREKYLPEKEKLCDRFIGVRDDRGKLCGAVICWEDLKDGSPVSSVHWLITDPDHQNRGLGTAMVHRLIGCFREKGALPIYLHTQPWSYTAIGIYSRAGFRLLKSDSFAEYKNQSAEALEVLKGLMPGKGFKKLVDEMI